MIDIPVDALLELPVDQIGLAVLRDLAESNEWNEHNYLLSARAQYTGDALNRIAEAMAWLRARALIARTPGQTSADAIFITRTGLRVLDDGPLAFYATERLQGGVHPTIEREARPQFLIGKYELGVFASIKGGRGSRPSVGGLR